MANLVRNVLKWASDKDEKHPPHKDENGKK
jgi:hypothetical protein